MIKRDKPILLASFSRNEAISKWILQSAKNLASTIDILFIDELLRDYEIHDELNDQSVKIRWYKNDTLIFSNESHCLLNRITGSPPFFYDNFQEGDRDYAKRELEAYLGFAFNQFQSVQRIAVDGICEKTFSLPQQWSMVAKHLQLSVPVYYWGYKEFNPLGNLSHCIYSSIYNLLNWSQQQFEENENYEFCYLRPKGIPVFILSVGQKHLITSDLSLSNRQELLLQYILQHLRDLFPYFIFELLVFIESDHVTFGCINIDVLRSKKNKQFDSFLDQHLIKEYYRCLN